VKHCQFERQKFPPINSQSEKTFFSYEDKLWYKLSPDTQLLAENCGSLRSMGRMLHSNEACGEPAISLHSYHVSLVHGTTRLLPDMRDPGSIPRGVLV
jgi:hypothetical protein